MKHNKIATEKFKQVKFLEEYIFISCITYDVYISCITFYEVKRGLLYVNAARKLSTFNRFCQEVTILFLDNLEIIEKAIEIHMNLRRKGRPIQDADILIAATAITKNLTLVSNDSDMSRVEGINLENWLEIE